MIKISAKKRIIYIAGYGHSGTTILEILLSSSDNIVGLGELVRVPFEIKATYTKHLFERNNYCQCMYKRIVHDLALIGERIESIKEINQFEHLLNKKKRVSIKRYKKFWVTFFNAAASDLNKPVNTFIDSSKTSIAHAFRPILLHHIDSFDVTIIHIIRHPKPILWRLKKMDL